MRAISTGATSYIQFSVSSRQRNESSASVRVHSLIIDDTYLPKIGFKTEKIGKAFSHTIMKPILGSKAMFLCFSDGVSQSMIAIYQVTSPTLPF